MITRTVTGDRKVRKIKEPHLVRLFCKIGAGAVQSYSHAENTGLVISDAAKIEIFPLSSKFFSSEIGKSSFSLMIPALLFSVFLSRLS